MVPLCPRGCPVDNAPPPYPYPTTEGSDAPGSALNGNVKTVSSAQSPPQSEAFKEPEKQKIEALRDELERIRAAASLDIQNLTSRLVGADREITRLKNKLSGLQDEDSPEAKEVLALLKLWKREIKGDHPNVKADLKSTRAEKVRAAVKRRGIEMCRKAVLGAQFSDFHMGRVAKTGGKTYNDIAEHILNTDGDIENFAGLYDEHYASAPELFRRLVAEGNLPVQKHPMRIALEGLRDHACGFRPSSTEGQYVAQCPLHEDTPWTLYVRMAHGRCRLLCSLGCDEYTLLTGVAGFIGPSDWTLRTHPVHESLRVIEGGKAA